MDNAETVAMVGTTGGKILYLFWQNDNSLMIIIKEKYCIY